MVSTPLTCVHSFNKGQVPMSAPQPSVLTATDIANFDADAELITLGQQFDAAWNKQQHIEALASNDDAGDALLSDAVETTSCISKSN